MSTVIAATIAAGVIIVADRRHTQGNIVSGTQARVFTDPGGTTDVGGGVIGDPGATEQFQRQFADALQTAARDQPGGLYLDVIARVGARVADQTRMMAVVGARTEAGKAEMRHITADGGVLTPTTVSLGTGKAVAASRLDTLDQSQSLAAATTTLEQIMTTVAERDPQTGSNIDVCTIHSDT